MALSCPFLAQGWGIWGQPQRTCPVLAGDGAGGDVEAAGSPGMQTTAPAGSPGTGAKVWGQWPWGQGPCGAGKSWGSSE